MLQSTDEKTNKWVISTCPQDATITCHLQKTSLDQKKKLN